MVRVALTIRCIIFGFSRRGWIAQECYDLHALCGVADPAGLVYLGCCDFYFKSTVLQGICCFIDAISWPVHSVGFTHFAWLHLQASPRILQMTDTETVNGTICRHITSPYHRTIVSDIAALEQLHFASCDVM